MLALKRKISETVTITIPDGRKIVVMLVDVCDRKHARLGFEADRDIAIFRTELLEETPNAST